MWKRSILAAMTICIAGGVVGCGAMTKGETQIKYTKNEELPGLITVDRPGDFALYTTTDVTPQVVQHLESGDKLGFIRGDDGSIRAVAGSYSKTIPGSTLKAYWKREARKM